MNEIVRHTDAPMTGTVALVPQNMDQAIRLAQAMSSAKMVPKHLQGDIGTCLMVVEQAMRWRMSPFAVAQCTSNISGRLNFEGKLVAAAVECSGAIDGGFDYQFAGAGDDRTITVSAKRRGETAPRSMTIRLGDVKTTNEWWKKQPDQQLVYSGTRNWARRWAPSVMLGVYAPEEFNRDGTSSQETFDGTTIEAAAEPGGTREAINASVPLRDPAETAVENDPTIGGQSPLLVEILETVSGLDIVWLNKLPTDAQFRSDMKALPSDDERQQVTDAIDARKAMLRAAA